MNDYFVLAEATTGGSIATAITNVCRGIYSTVGGVITFLAMTVVAICVIGMMVSKNQKTVEEFRAWRNRVLTGWIVFNCLGLISTQLEEWIPKDYNYSF